MSVVFKSYPLENDLEMAAVVLGGLPSSVVKRIGAFLGIRATKVGSIVKINEKTLDRRLKSGARLKPDESERLARLMRIISHAVSALESEDNARQWLQRPLRELGGQTPLQLASTDPGPMEDEQLLGRIVSGLFECSRPG